MLPPFRVQLDAWGVAAAGPSRVHDRSASDSSATSRRRRKICHKPTMINPSNPVAPQPLPPPPPPDPVPPPDGGGGGDPEAPPPLTSAFNAQPGFVPSPA